MYELVSRQVVNYQKLSVYFSSNIDPVIRKEIQQCLGIHCTYRFDKYAPFGRFKRTELNYILDRYTLRSNIDHINFSLSLEMRYS